ncbi:MAG TPA: DUF2079 domain-containing protein [Ktedonobacteraceae bacterium]|jgi:uncharacterized membrane protein|nr:DUF2079 domain-containing protein [Ktedonobacteraceae bacterium]
MQLKRISWSKRFDFRTQQWMSWALLIIVTLVYSLEMSHQSILRYDTFRATAFDLGNMDQVIWNTLHGRLFQFTNQAIDWYGPPTRLAIHFEPIILPLSLLYLFHADPRILLVFQTLALASGSLPVFLLTRKFIPEWPLLAPLMATGYLLSPAVLGLNIFDFHPVSLATPLLLYAVLALTYRRYVWFLIACVLAASCKEDIPLAIAMFGILVMWKYKLPRLGLTLLIGGALWSLLAFKVIIPHFYPGLQANNYWYRYEALGSSPQEAIINIILHPWLLFTLYFTLDRLYYLASLLRSTGFLALLAPEWLLPTLPSLAVNLLSTDPLLYSGVYHYNAAIIPFVMIAAIHGTRRLLLIWQGWRGEVPVYVDEVVENTHSMNGKMQLPLVMQKRLASLKSVWLPRLRSLGDRLLRLTFPAWWKAQWQRFSERVRPIACSLSVFRLQWLMFAWITLMFGLNFWIARPDLNSFWADHDPGPREAQIVRLLSLIPPDASVSASDDLNPHLSERRLLAVFPSVCLDRSCNQTVQYVVVDLASPTFANRAQALSALNGLSRQFRVLARAGDVVLLVRRSA